jgi:spoIIIJ-associated protein
MKMAEKKGFLGSLFGMGAVKDKNSEDTESAENNNGNGDKPERKPREIMEITPAVVDNARLTLLEILKTMQFDVDVAAKETNHNTIYLEITGQDDLGLAIGKEGNTLNALQFLLSNILSKKYQKRVYVHVDANDYKAKQEQSIIAAANDAADVAERENVQIILDPMTAAERRLVHTILQTRESIETFSRGEGPNRQVVVSPKGFNNKELGNK